MEEWNSTQSVSAERTGTPGTPLSFRDRTSFRGCIGGIKSKGAFFSILKHVKPHHRRNTTGGDETTSTQVPRNSVAGLEPSIELQSREQALANRPEFQNLGNGHFHHKNGIVETEIRDLWEERFKHRINRILLKRCGKSKEAETCLTELLLVGPREDALCMRPTIVLSSPSRCDHFQKILDEMAADFIPKDKFQTLLVDTSATRELVLWSSSNTGLDGMLPSSNSISERLSVEFAVSDESQIIGQHSQPMHAVLCRILLKPGLHCYFTVGGFIDVNGKVYALTTAHQLYLRTEDGKTTEKIHQSSSAYVQKSVREDARFCPLGTVVHARWGPVEEFSNQPSTSLDWALIELHENIANKQIFSILTKTFVSKVTGIYEGVGRDKYNGFRDVWICCGRSVSQKGQLNSTSSSLMLGRSFFKVYSINLQSPLLNGDSGSWVLLDGQICGHIICRSQNSPKAFMLPIQQIFQDIKSNPMLSSLSIPTIAEVKNRIGTKKPATSHSTRTTDFDNEWKKNDIAHVALGSSLGNCSKTSFQASAKSVLPPGPVQPPGYEIFDSDIRVDTSDNLSSSTETFISEFGSTTERCPPSISGPFQEHQLSKSVPGMPQDETIADEDNPWNPHNVLTFDGGGIRGYYSLLCLRYLMERVKELEDNFTDGNGIQHRARSSFYPLDESHGIFLPCHYFDYIGGTSTGGLIAIMLSRLRMSVDDCIKAYLQLGGRVFGSPLVGSLRLPFISDRTKFDARVLEEAIDEIVNKHSPPEEEKRFKSQSGFCKTFVCAYKQEGAASQLYIFRSYSQYTRPDATARPLNPGGASLHHIWEVARATSAATFHFPPLVVYPDDRGHRQSTLPIPRRKSRAPEATFLDGGLGHANNPSTEIYRELMRLRPPGHNGVFGTFISIGTGRKLADPFEKGFVKKVRAAFDATGNTEVAHEEMQMHSREVNFSYTRLNEPECLKDLKFGEWKGKGGRQTIKKIEDVFRRWISQPEQQTNFYKCAWELVRRRRLRSSSKFSSEWERYAVGTYFVCDKRCSASEGQRWSRRDEFMSHLIAEHDMEAELSIDDEAARDEIIDRYISSRWEYPSPSK